MTTYLFLESIFISNTFWNRDTKTFEDIADATSYSEDSIKHCIEHHVEDLPAEPVKIVKILKP